MTPQQILAHTRSPEGIRNPQVVYSQLRETAPVYRDPDTGMIYITRWADCDRLLRSPDFTAPHLLEKDPRFADSPSLQFLATGLPNLDAPTHTRFRREVQKSFSVPVLRKSEGFLRELVAENVAALRDRTRFDVVADYATAIPSTVICVLLGVPVEDKDVFARWIADQFRLLGPERIPDETLAEVDATTRLLLEYMGDLIERRRREPQIDIISGLVASQDTSDDPMSLTEMAVTTSILLAGGSDSTRTSIATGVKFLLENEDQLADFLDDPSTQGAMFEEVVRLGGAVVLGNLRKATVDTEIGGEQVRSGDLVVPVIAAANVDPEKFEDPFRFDIRRRPNPHIGFGGGIHVCVGNMLARMVAPIAISELVRTYPDMRLTGEVEDASTAALRSLASVWVERASELSLKRIT